MKLLNTRNLKSKKKWKETFFQAHSDFGTIGTGVINIRAVSRLVLYKNTKKEVPESKWINDSQSGLKQREED